MIRINLSPSVKRKIPQGTRAITAVQMVVPTTKASRGSVYAVLMLLGWIAIGVVAYLVQTGVAEDAQRLAIQTGALVKDAKAINDKIDEEGLQARKNYGDEVNKAIAALETKRRTPVYVYHELTNVLTTGKQPTIIEIEQRRRVDLDPQARLKLDWDANSVWIKSMVETDGGGLEISGGARDPDDLSEFVKRLRASARFSRVSHPKFKLEEVKSSSSSAGTKKQLKPGDSLQNYYSFELTAQVRYWD